jgi:hypothetical protein
MVKILCFDALSEVFILSGLFRRSGLHVGVAANRLGRQFHDLPQQENRLSIEVYRW